MFNKKSLIILILTIHLTISLRSNDFCIVKQQDCKGFYDKNDNYKTKCEPVMCHGKYENDCGLGICSINKTECFKYNQLDMYMKMVFKIQPINPVFAARHAEQKKEFELFRNYIADCKNKFYKFNLYDFCINGKDCKTVRRIFGLIQGPKNIDCKCPKKLSYKCNQYCTSNSVACDYFKSNKIFYNIKNCGNQNITYFRSFFTIG